MGWGSVGEQLTVHLQDMQKIRLCPSCALEKRRKGHEEKSTTSMFCDTITVLKMQAQVPRTLNTLVDTLKSISKTTQDDATAQAEDWRSIGLGSYADSVLEQHKFSSKNFARRLSALTRRCRNSASRPVTLKIAGRSA